MSILDFQPNYEALSGSSGAEANPEEQGRLGDAVDQLQAGALGVLGGVLDVTGATQLAQDVYGWQESQRDTMSQRGRDALDKEIFTENENGELSFGEGASDVDTWLLNIANLAGQFIPTMVPGGIAGKAASMLGAGSKATQAARIGGYSAGGGSAATGQAMEQGRQEVLGMPDTLLYESERFREIFKQELEQDPQGSDIKIWNAAKSRLAEAVASDIKTDPKVLIANFAGSAIGDPIIGRALLGARLAKSGALRSALKGAAVEGTTEAAQGGVQEYAINEKLSTIDNRDPMQGVKAAAASEGLLAGGFGGIAGGIGGVINRQDRPSQQPTQDLNDSPPDPAAPNGQTSSTASTTSQQPPGSPVGDAIRDSNPTLAEELDATNDTQKQNDAALAATLNSISEIPAAARREGINNVSDAARFGDAMNGTSMTTTERSRIPRDSNTDLDIPAASRQANFRGNRGASQFGQMLESDVQEALREDSRNRTPSVSDLLKNASRENAPTPEDRFLPRQFIYEGDVETKAGADVTRGELPGRTFDGQRVEPLAAGQDRIVDKDIVFADDQTGIITKSDGSPYRSKKESLASIKARKASREGKSVEAVKFGKGWGLKVTNKDSQPAADLAETTKPDDAEWVNFKAETETKRIPRAQMPQIKAEHRGALANFLNARGIDQKQQEVDANTLKPTQLEFSPAKVKKAMQFTGTDRAILVSKDNHIIDGHHQWLAKREMSQPVKVIRLNADVEAVLKTAAEFPSSFQESDTEPNSSPQLSASTSEITPAEDAGVFDRPQAKTQPINDFGEKIGGARKDTWSGYRESLDQGDARTQPLSKAFPEPDYQQLADSNVPKDTTALVAAMRGRIKPKPRKYGVVQWADEVERVKSVTKKLLDGEITTEKAIDRMKSLGESTRAIARALPITSKADPSVLKEAVKYTIGEGDGLFVDGKKIGRAYYIEKHEGKRGRMLWETVSPDLKEVENELSKIVENLNTEGVKQTRSKTKLSVYSDRRTGQVFVGWKGASGILRVKNFETTTDAREALRNDRESLDARLEEIKKTPSMRKPVNTARVGPEYISEDVTPELFGETFGFRGVEFGNWVEQGRRQQDLNRTYDSLMDLASILDVEPKALSLNGELAIAFGARGKGGSNAASAHYEPSRLVINLTKKSGAGSLAHEWWHALDNYLARQNGNQKEKYLSSLPYSRRLNGVRTEVSAAVADIMRAIRKTDLPARAKTLDERRSKVYWSTDVEMSARTFENFVIEELGQRKQSNDHLANIVSEDYWRAAEDLGLDEGSTYPYLTEGEIKPIHQAFRNLFDVLETSTDAKTGKIKLFSKRAGLRSKPKQSASAADIRQMANKFMKRINGGAGIKVVVFDTQAEAAADWEMSLDGAIVRGGFSPERNTAYIIAENAASIEDAQQTLSHEVLAHGGLKNVISDSDHQEFLNRIKATRVKRDFREAWAQIEHDYDGFDADTKAEEFFARFVENEPTVGSVKYWWKSLKRWLNNVLAKVGITKVDIDTDMMHEMLEAIVDGFRSGRSTVRINGRNSVSLSKTNDQSDNRAPAAESDIKFSRSNESLTAEQKIGQQVARESIKSRLNGVFDQIKSKGFRERLTEGLFDGLHGIKRAEETAGITDPNKQGYVSARLATGIGDALHALFNRGALEWRDGVLSTKADTKGLLEVFDMLPDGKLNDWLAWMAGNRAERLKAEGRENNLTDDDIQVLKAKAEGHEEIFEQVRAEYNKINLATLEVARDAGLLTQSQIDAFDTKWYVPFYREMSDPDPESDVQQVVNELIKPFTGKPGIVGQSAQIEQLKGGDIPTRDLLSNIIQRQVSLLDASVKNQAAREVARNLDGTGFMERDDADTLKELKRSELNSRQKVRIMDNGQVVHYYVADAALLRGLMHVNDIGSKSLFNRVSRSAKRFLTTGVTLSPDFIIRNFVRDAAHSWMVNKDKMKFGIDTAAGLKESFKQSDEYWDMIAGMGAFQGGYIHGTDPEAAQQQVRRALREKGYSEAETERYMGSILDTKDKLWRVFEKYRGLSDKVENANRLATYRKALEAGKSRRQALYEAKDLMDYSMKGNFGFMGTFIDMLPFFNARLQGLYKLGRAAGADGNDRIIKVLSRDLAMKGLKVAAFSTALAALNYDDERYKELPDWDKDAHWHIFLGEGNEGHFRIPKPFELGIIFGTLPERLFGFASGSQTGDELSSSVAHATMTTLSLNPLPQFAVPMIEVIMNHSFFLGSPIEGMADQRKQTVDRYNADTSDTARAASSILGQHFGLSPKEIEHLARGYAGTLGSYVLGMSDFLARSMTGRIKADTPVADWPVIKTLYQGGKVKGYTSYQDHFFEALDTAREAYGSYKNALEENDQGRIQELFEERAEELNARLAMERVQRKVSKLNTQMRLVDRDSRLSSDAKRRKIDELTKVKNELYQQAYVRLNMAEW